MPSLMKENECGRKEDGKSKLASDFCSFQLPGVSTKPLNEPWHRSRNPGHPLFLLASDVTDSALFVIIAH